ncbi:MAG: hypothetical protein ACE5K7_08340 [Phycisphaerae bacterium]
MRRKAMIRLVVALVCGATLLQIGACGSVLGDLGLRLAGVLFLDQFVGPLVGDPAGDLGIDLSSLCGSCGAAGQDAGQ